MVVKKEAYGSFLLPWGSSGSDTTKAIPMNTVTTTATIRDNQVFSNTADLGGGLYLHESEATLISNAILSNTAGASGGGMLLWASSAAMAAE